MDQLKSMKDILCAQVQAQMAKIDPEQKKSEN